MPTTKVKEEITSKIKSGELTMKPKWYFVVGTALLFQGTLGAILLGIFVSNLCFYHLRNYGPFGYLFLGREGFSPFLETFPWKLLIVAGLSLIVGYKLLKKYEFSYSKHSVYLFLILMASILIAGLLTDLAGFNERVRHNRFLNPVYSERFLGHDWMMGEIRQKTNDGFILETPQGDLVQIKVNKQTVSPHGNQFDEGRRVRLVGAFYKDASRSGDFFEAKAAGLDEGMRWRRYQVKGAMTHKPQRLLLVK
ncbi:MAG: hypothetical protein OEX81_05445 [Candidatus Pacebacteria bacterium]|nr:hypothetical protein [Candidatus Paceibacterota bacterium]